MIMNMICINGFKSKKYKCTANERLFGTNLFIYMYMFSEN